MMDAGLAPIIFLLMVSTTAVHSQITKGPVNALKKVGDSVSLDCVTRSKNCDNVEWSKMEGAQSARKVYTGGIILNDFPGERYNVSSTGGCSLTIRGLGVNDSGRFSCVLTVGDREVTRSSVLVVIDVTEACRSNVTSNALNQNDSYSFSTAINVPAKSVEPSDVILFFPTKAADETETKDNSQSQTVKTTLTGIARKENITQRVYNASFPPNSAANFDTYTATLEVCTTQELIVSYPAENIAVSPSPGTYYTNGTVRCIADGHPSPTFQWTHLKSGKVVTYGDTLLITGEVGDQYSCTATNIVKGKAASLSITITVVSPSPPPPPPPHPPEPDAGCGPGCIGGIVGGVVAVVVAIGVTCFFVSKRDN